MSSILDLVDVQFIDETGYPVPQESRDTMGVVMDYHWGPSDSLQVMTAAAFYQNYPESLPIGAPVLSNNQNVYAYAQIKQAFRNGLQAVEVCRFATSVDGIDRTAPWKYSQLAINLKHAGAQSSDPTYVEVPAAMSAQTSQFGTDADTLYISYKYAGCPPKSLMPTGFEYLWLKVTEQVTSKSFKVEVYATKTATWNAPKKLEEFVGGIDKSVVNGVSTYLPDVLAASNFIAAYYGGVEQGWTGTVTYGDTTHQVSSAVTYANLVPASPFTAEATAIADIYLSKYGDIELSYSKLFISPFPQNQTVDFSATSYDDAYYTNNIEDGIDGFVAHKIAYLDEAIQLIPERRYNCIAAIGYPLPVAGGTDNFTKAAMCTWLSWDKTNEKFVSAHVAGNPYRYKYTQAVIAREFITVFGKVIQSNGAGGWCGATTKIAREVRLNQAASAKQYGSYVGYLEKSLKFGDVNYLHGIGATSIHTAAQGPRIFGIHTLCPTFASYFAQTNVMRVTAAVLNEVLPASVNAVHTQVAADPIEMSSFEVNLNSIIEGYVAGRNLKPQSNAVCNSTINTEKLTERGKKLNIILNLWYINLTEKISIKIVATDESVTAEFVQ